MAKKGRPSKYTQALADSICDRLATGESLNSICADDDMPHRHTVAGWAIDNQAGEFLAKYTRAREIGLDVMADEVLSIADDSSQDTRKDEEGNERTDHEHIARSKLRFDARRWYLSKLAPKRYGDKIVQEHQGAGGGPIEMQLIEALNRGRERLAGDK